VIGHDERSSAEEAALHLTGDTGVETFEGLDSGQSTGRAGTFSRLMTRYGLLVALLLMILAFGILEPDSFLSIANLRTTASLAAPLLVLAIALTVPLGLGEFDLSISASTQLAGAVIIWFISMQGWPLPLAIIVTVLFAAALGTSIGALVVKSGVNAFIITLGAATILTGLEFGISRGSTIYSDIPPAYVKIANGRLWGVPTGVLVALAFGLIIWVLMERTVVGRQMRAIGGNAEAARLSGVRVDVLRALGFTITGIGAAVAAVLLTSQSASYYPNSASALLLAVYAACFLGTTVFRQNIFQVEGTIVGVAFLAILQSGLIMVGIASWIADIIQGTLLIGAVVLSKLVSRRPA
jgi:ribose transport system permease protein